MTTNAKRHPCRVALAHHTHGEHMSEYTCSIAAAERLAIFARTTFHADANAITLELKRWRNKYDHALSDALLAHVAQCVATALRCSPTSVSPTREAA